jgi:AcrR family transcriptional regulator
VEAIFEATAQILIESGLNRFSTDRVAKRAGVSIGTLYQYFPNKQTLVYSLLERYLDARDNALEETCQALGGRPVETLIAGAVNTYIDSKLDHVDLAAALYAAAVETGAAAILKRTSDRCCKALSRALARSTDHLETVTDFPAVMIFGSMTETTRAVLQLGATPEQLTQLRKHLSLLCCSYVQTWLNEQAR